MRISRRDTYFVYKTSVFKVCSRPAVIGAVDSEGTLLGFASYGTFRAWPAYKYSVEHSVYVHKDHRGKGIGLVLMHRLIAAARDNQIHVMVGGIDVENAGSIDVLLKPGRLTPKEWEEMKAHSIRGERILNDTFLSNRVEVASIIRHHHESFDGTGYPDGLSGSEIPKSCRIILVIDAYDAMTTGRPYHRARSHSETMSILDQEVGTKFDPEIFEVAIVPRTHRRR